MKVNISTVGRFHAFNLASELENRGYLNKLITTYPKFKVSEWSIPNNKIVSKILYELFRRYGEKIKILDQYFLDNIAHKGIALTAAKFIDQADISIGWSGNSLEAIYESNKQGKIFILERGSSHYSYQMEILKEEAKRQNLKDFQPNIKHWERELLEYKYTDYISVPSQFVYDTFIDFGISENKLIKNPYGVNLEEFYPVEKEDDTFRVIHCGGISYRKGIPYLLKAYSELNLENSELWIVGSVDTEIKDYIEQYRDENIIFHGAKKQSELYWYLSQCDVFCLASIEEGLAMVQAQAMACGLPIITTKNTGGGELVENNKNGFVIPIRDIEAIKEKILYLYKNKESSNRMGQKAIETVHNGFSWSDYGDRYAENLKEIYSKHFKKKH
tara:strand:- start:292 stop:1452 length:1161 start_codon:yes stop_codon:yes gene_type:complete